MSIITTIYTQRLTITTADDGTRTITRDHNAQTSTAYLFHELSEAAKDRAVNDAINEEDREYYEYGVYGASQTGASEYEIWEAAEDLEKHQPVIIERDQGGTPYGRARRYRWSTPNWEAVTEQQHTGICWSMDICDVWNAYARRIVVLQEGHEEATAELWKHEEAAAEAMSRELKEHELDQCAECDHIAQRCEDIAEELTEEAAQAVGNAIDGLIESERDYYTSPEFWEEWLDDGEARFTRDGERI